MIDLKHTGEITIQAMPTPYVAAIGDAFQ